MPLPSEGTSWPPNENTTTSEAMREHSAWYSGDPAQLGAFYVSRTGAVARPAQFSGGLVGKLARWWWGTPAGAGEAAAKLHVPLAADICGTSADLLYSEPVRLSSDSETVTRFLAELQEDGLDTKLHEGAEVGAALGGRYMRVTWDSTVSPRPWSTVVHADGAVPEFRHGRLMAVNLWSQLSGGSKVYRHVERHEPEWIIHALYLGTATNLGKVVPLAEHPTTAYLAPLVNEQGAQATGTKRLTVTYVPNMLPNRLDRHSPLGRSDLQGVTPMLDALDEAYSSWWRDIRHAKSRIHVPASYLQASDGPGSTAIADVDRELYVPIEGALARPGDGLLIDVQQFKIRVAEHSQTCQDWTKTIIESAGYSTQSLSGDTGGAVTAAEVHSHERRSYMTRGKKARYETAALRDHLQTMVEVANANLKARLTAGSIGVEFADGVQDSPLSLANTALALRNAEAASIETRVRIVNQDWTDQQVTDEVTLIMREASGGGSPLPVPGDAGF